MGTTLHTGCVKPEIKTIQTNNTTFNTSQITRFPAMNTHSFTTALCARDLRAKNYPQSLDATKVEDIILSLYVC